MFNDTLLTKRECHIMPNDSLKIPSQIFRWFEKMKSNYENNIHSVLSRFEQQNDKQQGKIEQSYQSHLDDLANAHQMLIESKNEQINKLEQEIAYFKTQLAQQQEMNAQLNTRYDAIIGCLIKNQHDAIDIKDVFNEDDLSEQQPEQEGIYQQLTANDDNKENIDLTTEQLDAIYQQAVEQRQHGEVESAFRLFLQAANQQHAKSMGALGRAYFLAEGVEENQSLGLAWLMNAAALGLPQAIERVEQFQQAEPFLYKQAELLSAELLSAE